MAPVVRFLIKTSVLAFVSLVIRLDASLLKLTNLPSPENRATSSGELALPSWPALLVVITVVAPVCKFFR